MIKKINVTQAKLKNLRSARNPKINKKIKPPSDPKNKPAGVPSANAKKINHGNKAIKRYVRMFSLRSRSGLLRSGVRS